METERGDKMNIARSGHFAQTLIRYREDFRGFTRAELAKKAELSRSVIYKWETQQSLPDVDDLYALADALDIPVELLVARPAKGDSE